MITAIEAVLLVVFGPIVVLLGVLLSWCAYDQLRGRVTY